MFAFDSAAFPDTVYLTKGNEYKQREILTNKRGRSMSACLWHICMPQTNEKALYIFKVMTDFDYVCISVMIT